MKKKHQWKLVPPPAPPPKGIHQVLIVPAGAKGISFQALTNSVDGIWTHFIHDAWPAPFTVPCLGNSCLHDLGGYRRCWKGYLPVYNLFSKRPAVLELPLAAARNLNVLLADGRDRSTYFFQALRENPARKDSKIRFTVWPCKEALELPPTFDPLPSAMHMWNFHPDRPEQIELYAAEPERRCAHAHQGNT